MWTDLLGGAALAALAGLWLTARQRERAALAAFDAKAAECRHWQDENGLLTRTNAELGQAVANYRAARRDPPVVTEGPRRV